jgi:hypothetical protein
MLRPGESHVDSFVWTEALFSTSNGRLRLFRGILRRVRFLELNFVDGMKTICPSIEIANVEVLPQTGSICSCIAVDACDASIQNSTIAGLVISEGVLYTR